LKFSNKRKKEHRRKVSIRFEVKNATVKEENFSEIFTFVINTIDSAFVVFYSIIEILQRLN